MRNRGEIDRKFAPKFQIFSLFATEGKIYFAQSKRTLFTNLYHTLSLVQKYFFTSTFFSTENLPFSLLPKFSIHIFLSRFASFSFASFGGLVIASSRGRETSCVFFLSFFRISRLEYRVRINFNYYRPTSCTSLAGSVIFSAHHQASTSRSEGGH